MRTLGIISHTEHYIDKGKIVGWGPTIREINYLSNYFDRIIHLAVLLKDDVPPNSSISYESDNIEFRSLNPTGGKNVLDKLNIIYQAPKTTMKVSRLISDVDYWQFRSPTGIGVYLIPYLTYLVRKKGWFKYAGNWGQINPPFGYRFQRSILKNQSRIVTINGKWKNQPNHCLSFENPCLTSTDRSLGREICEHKKTLKRDRLRFCFAGRLENEKGVQRILNVLKKLNSKNVEFYFAGDGELLEYYKSQGLKNCYFLGFISNEKLFDLYKKCDFFVLPTLASEGFPKVIAEAMNFGCIPIVTAISAIGHYINKENGFILSEDYCEADLERTMASIILKKDNLGLQSKIDSGYRTSSFFTFEHYKNRILKEVLNEA